MFLKICVVLLLLGTGLALVSDENCGYADNSKSLIVGGKQVEAHEWPWSVAIRHRTNNFISKFICGGTLITRKKVISAAHCFHEKSTPKSKLAKDILMVLGAFDLDDDEPNARVVTVHKLTIHPDWSSNTISHDADIAVLDMLKEVEISKYIRPICIWEEEKGIPTFKTGIVVGWGKSGNASDHEAIARKLEVPFVEDKKCFEDNPTFRTLSSAKTFCGGDKMGRGPCNGDSGSGLYFESEKKYYLGGIVSSSKYDELKNCDVYNYAVYTNFYKFLGWLSNEKKKSEEKCDYFKINLPVEKKMYNKSQMIVSGQYRHLALVGFKEKGGVKKFKGNGCLISKRYVLTSAKNVLIAETPTFVRLGSGSTDIKNESGESIAEDVDVEALRTHKKFGQYKYDIGLIKLDREVGSTYIWPACLQTTSMNEGTLWHISTWKTDTEGNSKFLKLAVEEIPLKKCEQFALYKAQPLINNQKCISTKGLSEDLEIGSSGSPLEIIKNGMVYVGGLVSYAATSNTKPSKLHEWKIITQTSSFIDWIDDIVWSAE